jgi:hypothetical protein
MLCCFSLKKKEVVKTANKSHTDGKKEGGSFVIAHLSVETQFNQGSHRVEFTRFRRPTTTVIFHSQKRHEPLFPHSAWSNRVIWRQLKFPPVIFNISFKTEDRLFWLVSTFDVWSFFVYTSSYCWTVDGMLDFSTMSRQCGVFISIIMLWSQCVSNWVVATWSTVDFNIFPISFTVNVVGVCSDLQHVCQKYQGHFPMLHQHKLHLQLYNIL